MNATALPEVDTEANNEVLYEFERHHALIEEHIYASADLQDHDALHMILCEIHSIRENAAMLQLSEIMSFTNAIENIIFSIINGNLAPTHELSEALLMAMDHLRNIHLEKLSDAQFDDLNITRSEQALTMLAVAQTKSR
ncbi:MAG: hypothetical protein COA42_07320 [Alteromonadaceae bacterium]|nr:MAG: hypothetical protein COA42_07320 [Alteromonadaceae bacterium]